MYNRKRYKGKASNRAMDKYLREISQFNPLSSDEEVRLTIKIRAGDKAALRKLIRSNLRFVVKIAKEYQGFLIDGPNQCRQYRINQSGHPL